MRTRLYRSRRNRVIGGVCGGLAEYFHTDPVAIRLAWLLLVLLGGSGIPLYILAWIIMPDERYVHGAARSPGPTRQSDSWEPSQPTEPATPSTAEVYPDSPLEEPDPTDVGRRTRLGGAVLIAVGAYFLIDRLVYFDLSAWWPVLLILGGVALLFTSRQDSQESSPSDSSRGTGPGAPPAPAAAESEESPEETDEEEAPPGAPK